MLIILNSAGLLYASTSDGHIFTTPGDSNWTALLRDPKPGVAVNALSVVNANIIYAGMASGHLGLTQDGGHSGAFLPNTGTASILSLGLLH